MEVLAEVGLITQANMGRDCETRQTLTHRNLKDPVLRDTWRNVAPRNANK